MEELTKTELEQSIKNNTEEKPSAFSNIIMGLLIFLIVFMVILTGYRYFFITVEVSGESMKPTLTDGEYLVINRLAVPEREDIVVIDVGKKWIIKRVVGVEGDTIKIENGKVYRKTEKDNVFNEIEEDYTIGETNLLINPATNTWVVGKNQFFFLGDNRENSSDSRLYGIKEMNDIVGVVTEWSKDKKGFWYTFNEIVNFPSKIFTSCNGKTGD